MRFVAVASLVGLTIATGLTGLHFALAQAQSGATWSGAPSSSGRLGGEDTSMSLRRPIVFSIEDMQKESDQVVSRITLLATSVRKMLEQARAQNDLVKSECLNPYLTELDVTLRSAKDRRSSLDSNATLRQKDSVEHDFAILNEYRKQAEKIAAQANQCVGSETGFIGETKVSTYVDPTIPSEGGPAFGPVISDTPPIFVSPPNCASCSLLFLVESP